MSISTTRLFMPLTGTELKTTILNDFKARLDNSQLFVDHLTFPRATYKVELTLESYPMDNAETIVIDRAIGDSILPEGAAKKKDKITFSREIGETQETAPDAIREQNDLPTTRPERQGDTGMMIDAPQSPKPKVTVGKGTLPRGKTAPKPILSETEAIPVDEEPLLDDAGNPVKANRF